MALIETINLTQKYGDKVVLEDINLQISRGEVFALIGPTGAGKTTLFRILDLLELPSSGRVSFDGVEVPDSRGYRLALRRRMAFVQQKPIVFDMSVYDNVASGLRWRRERESLVRGEVAAALEMVAMAEYAPRNARTLSGGETQRVAIARALAVKPEVLFLDEPTANLDPASVAKIEEVLERVIREREITVLMATHDMPQGQRFAARIGVLIGGRIQQVGSPADIFSLPRSREVAEFVGVENILSGAVVERDDNLVTIEIKPVRIQAVSDFAVGEKVHVFVRPEDITFSRSPGKSSARNILEGTVRRTSLDGPLVRVEVDCGFPLLGVITKRSAEDLEIVAGVEVYASFKATAIHVVKRWE